jgi:hypothetical protein
MGNCYSAGQQDLETSLEQGHTKTLAKQRANAGFGIIDKETPGDQI